jgi:hypothetical protein
MAGLLSSNLLHTAFLHGSLKMVMISSSETSDHIRTIQRYIYNHSCENLKSYNNCDHLAKAVKYDYYRTSIHIVNANAVEYSISSPTLLPQYSS